MQNNRFVIGRQSHTTVNNNQNNDIELSKKKVHLCELRSHFSTLYILYLCATRALLICPTRYACINTHNCFTAHCTVHILNQFTEQCPLLRTGSATVPIYLKGFHEGRSTHSKYIYTNTFTVGVLL